MEAKFVTFSVVVQEALWLKQFLHLLSINANIADLVLVNYDSQLTIKCT